MERSRDDIGAWSASDRTPRPDRDLPGDGAALKSGRQLAGGRRACGTMALWGGELPRQPVGVLVSRDEACCQPRAIQVVRHRRPSQSSDERQPSTLFGPVHALQFARALVEARVLQDRLRARQSHTEPDSLVEARAPRGKAVKR